MPLRTITGKGLSVSEVGTGPVEWLPRHQGSFLLYQSCLHLSGVASTLSSKDFPNEMETPALGLAATSDDPEARPSGKLIYRGGVVRAGPSIRGRSQRGRRMKPQRTPEQSRAGPAVQRQRVLPSPLSRAELQGTCKLRVHSGGCPSQQEPYSSSRWDPSPGNQWKP